jgi:hypothetical protein
VLHASGPDLERWLPDRWAAVTCLGCLSHLE